MITSLATSINKNKNPDGHKCGLSREGEGEVVWGLPSSS